MLSAGCRTARTVAGCAWPDLSVPMSEPRERPLSIAILAVGGPGGSVLTNWLVDIAEANGNIAQSTFVTGVAQRTGATVYCVEMFPRDRAEAIGREPVFTPYPVPGDVDLVVVGEMAETGRAIQKGFVTPHIMTLIASSHRIYSAHEKEAMGDGIFDQAPVARIAEKASKNFICFDMAEAAVPAGKNGEALKVRVEEELPEQVRNMALHGALRALDYQDPKYAAIYLDRVRDMSVIDAGSHDYELTTEVARQLALQMCYEDTIRVADLKTRGNCFVKIREQVAAAPDQPTHVVEYFHPRIEEICDTLSSPIGALILRSGTLQKMMSPFFSSGRNVKTTSISGFLLLYIFAKFRRIRRGTYRFKRQQEFIHDWLDRVINAAVDDYGYALEIARSIEMVKGYGDTYQRGLTRYRAAVEAAVALPAADRAAAMRRLHNAALADEKGQVFGDALSTLESVH